MQPIIANLLEVLRGNTTLSLGYILMGILCLQASVSLINSLRRISYRRSQLATDLERLRLTVELARARQVEVKADKALWNGFRKFAVAKKVRECEDVCSFYLQPHDGKPLPPFKPGQYLTFQLKIPGQPKPLIRCYSLSDSPSHPDY